MYFPDGSSHLTNIAGKIAPKMGSHSFFDNELPQPEARDYSRPTLFNLAKERPNKTIDIGYNGVSVSSEPYGGVSYLVMVKTSS